MHTEGRNRRWVGGWERGKPEMKGNPRVEREGGRGAVCDVEEREGEQKKKERFYA